VCVCVCMEIAAHMVLPCHCEKKYKKYNERAVWNRSTRAYCTIIIIVVCVLWYVCLSLSLTPSHLFRLFRFGTWCFLFRDCKTTRPVYWLVVATRLNRGGSGRGAFVFETRKRRKPRKTRMRYYHTFHVRINVRARSHYYTLVS